MSLFERFIAKGTEKAGELAKEGAMLDGLVAQVRASTVQQERQEVHAVLQHAASLNCMVEEWKIVLSSSPCQKRSGPS